MIIAVGLNFWSQTACYVSVLRFFYGPAGCDVSFVITAPPPMGKGGDYDFSVSVPCYESLPQEGKLEVKTFLLALLFIIENILGVRILISKCHH